MRRSLIISLGIVSLALLIGVFCTFKTRLSDADVQAITAEVQKQTCEPIRSIRPMTRWRAHVETGKSEGPLSGGGHDYYLRWTWKGWRIYESSVWIG